MTISSMSRSPNSIILIPYGICRNRHTREVGLIPSYPTKQHIGSVSNILVSDIKVCLTNTCGVKASPNSDFLVPGGRSTYIRLVVIMFTLFALVLQLGSMYKLTNSQELNLLSFKNYSSQSRVFAFERYSPRSEHDTGFGFAENTASRI